MLSSALDGLSGSPLTARRPAPCSVASTARCSARRSMASLARRLAPRSMAQGLAPRSKARRSGHCSTLDGSMLGSALDSLCASTLSSARNGVGGSTFGFALDGNGSTLCSLLDGFNGSTYSLALEASAAQRSARRSIIYATRRSIVLSTAQCPSRRTLATQLDAQYSALDGSMPISSHMGYTLASATQ